MKTKLFTILAALMFFGVCTVKADTVWTSGHHEIYDGDVYGEIWMYNDCTLDIFGGDIGRLATFDMTLTNWHGGSMIELWMNDNSIANIYGGLLNRFDPGENAALNLFAYDVQYHPTGGYWNGGWIEGKYCSDDTYFDFDIPGQYAISHINIVPEPTTLMLFGLGGLFLRKKR